MFSGTDSGHFFDCGSVEQRQGVICTEGGFNWTIDRLAVRGPARGRDTRKRMRG